MCRSGDSLTANSMDDCCGYPCISGMFGSTYLTCVTVPSTGPGDAACTGDEACGAAVNPRAPRTSMVHVPGFRILHRHLAGGAADDRVIDRGRIIHAARAGYAQADQIPGAFFGSVIDVGEYVEHAHSRLDGERRGVRRGGAGGFRAEIDVEVLLCRTLLTEDGVERRAGKVLKFFARL